MILITGGKGQLGTELRHLLDEKRIDYISTDSNEMDITNAEGTMNFIVKLMPKVIYHCAAYTAVDKAEDEAKVINEKVNFEGTKNVADAAKKVGATFVYISTDYVFDGTLKNGTYMIDSQTNPQNEYGRTKLLGEQVVQKTLTNYYIIRTSWVFGQYGNNFVFTMQRLSRTKKTLNIVNDQYGRPTWTRTLSEFMYYIIEKNAPYGIYHLSNEGSCSWYEFAQEILKDEKNVDVLPIISEKFPQKAKRPQYSVMDISKAKNIGFNIIDWKDALHKMLNRIEKM